MTSEDTRHKSSVVLILIDVINHFDFPQGDRTLQHAQKIAPRLVRLKQRCRAAGIPAIYVNDNFGQWRSDAKSLVARCLEPDRPGKAFVEQIQPDD
jgi:nicotinamidase-related amidase